MSRSAAHSGPASGRGSPGAHRADPGRTADKPGSDFLPEEIAAVIGIGIDQREIEQLEALARLGEDYDIPWDGTGLADVRRRERSLQGAVPGVMAKWKVREEPRYTLILPGGLCNQPGEEVEPGTPEALPAMPEGVPRNRPGLAQWIVAPGNP